MSQSNRFGFGRGEAVADLKSPQVRVIGTPRRAPAPALAGDAPYPSRYDDNPRSRSLLEMLGLSRDEREIADDLFGEPEAPQPVAAPRASPKPQPTASRKRWDRGDVTLGALGIVLGLTCALFPWYIFFNQEKFGVREFVFEGSRSVTPPASVAYQPPLVGQHFQTGEVPRMELDLFPTATLPAENEAVRAVPVSDQPFPADLVNFRLVHVANGRAMIQDDDGLWIVQPGSRLPDASQVTAIEQRNGSWVLLTSHDKVVQLEP